MKSLLDRLVARQNRLMGQLAAADEAVPARAKPKAEVTASMRAQEAAAVAEASQHLAEGDIDAAHALLEPYATIASVPRTLTLLARMETAHGRQDKAEERLRAAERLDPSDMHVVGQLGDLLEFLGRHREALLYRRRAAFSQSPPSNAALVSLVKSIVKSATHVHGPSVKELTLALDTLKNAPDATPDQRRAAAQAAYRASNLETEACQLYQSCEPCPPDFVDQRIAWKKMRDWCSQSGSPHHVLNDGGRPSQRPQVAALNDALIMPGLQFVPVMPEAGVALTGVANRDVELQSVDARSPLLLANEASGVLRLPRRRPRMQAPAILLGGTGSYHRDLIDHIGLLAIVERFELAADRMLVINEHPAPFQLELLELLGYDASRLMPLPDRQATAFDSILAVMPLAHGGRWIDPMLPAWYRSRLVRTDLQGRSGRKLYLSQGNATQGRLANEPEVRDRLVALGYDVVAPESMSVKDQVHLFSAASEIVAPNTEALTNMLFAPPGARVTVMSNRLAGQVRGAVRFDGLAAACGHSFAMLESEPVRLVQGMRMVDAEITVDVEALVALLEAGPVESPQRDG